MYEHTRQKDFICGALIGGSIALLTSLLFTTKKGKQIQRKIADVYEDIEETVSDTFAEGKEKVEEGVDHLSKKATGHPTRNKQKPDDHPEK